MTKSQQYIQLIDCFSIKKHYNSITSKQTDKKGEQIAVDLMNQEVWQAREESHRWE